MTPVSQLLQAANQGDSQAAANLLPLVYEELRRLAVARLASEKPGHTLQPTALVHEAYLRLVGDQRFDGKGHFFAAAAEAMRRVLVDNARHNATAKRGGGRSRINLPENLPAERLDSDILAVDEALGDLAAHDSRVAELVKLHIFAGLPLEDAAIALGIAPRTAYRDWQYARAWLFRKLGE